MKKLIKNIFVIGLMIAFVSANAQKPDIAGASFENENYAQALAEYQRLADNGEKFAQYRLGLMHYFGLGTEKNIEQAYAWMTVAAEEDIQILRKFQLLIWDEMDFDQRERATEMAIINEAKSGTVVVDSTSNRKKRNRSKKCTSSRVGAGCDRVETFGFDLINRDDISPKQIPYEMTVEEAQDFNDEYKNMILADFEKYDTAD